MILVIDVGNTHTDFAIFKQGHLFASWHLETKETYTPDKYATVLLKILKQHGLDFTALKGVAISCVVPSLIPILKNLSVRFLGRNPIVIGEPGIEPGIRILIDHPETVGSDLVADVVAAKDQYGPKHLIIDLGTVSTLLPTDGEGNLCGGAFLPGLRLMKESLYLEAEQFPDFALQFPKKVVGKNAEEAMQSGLLFGYVDMINGLIRRIFNEGGEAMPIIVTGGFAQLIVDEISSPSVYDPELTLKGIYKVYERNHYLLDERKAS